jgi:hypothetical protein
MHLIAGDLASLAVSTRIHTVHTSLFVSRLVAKRAIAQLQLG